LFWGKAALTAPAAAIKHFCLSALFWVLCVCLFGAASALALPFPQTTLDQESSPEVPAGQPYVLRIEFDGNHRMRTDTLKARIFTREGDPYKPEALRRDFQALWNTGYFEDITLTVEDSPDHPNGKIVIFTVAERPIIRRIVYKGNKSVTESDILDAFKDRKVGLSVESQFDPTKIKKAQVVIQELLAAHGHQFAVVKPTYERIAASNAVVLTFNIDEGPKVKIGLITFQGNHAFSSAKLLRSMKHSRPYGIPLYFWNIPVMNKTFDRSALDEDLEVGVRALYQDNGYYKEEDEATSVETVDVHKAGIPGPWPVVGRKKGKATNIVIKIDEGDRYRMGKLYIRSSDPEKGLSLKRDALERIFPLHKGDIFSVAKVRKAVEDYTKLYGQFGFIDFTAEPESDVNESTKTIDLTLDFDEGKQFYVRRIEFAGNTTTRDKVIRRELLISEGDLFNNHLWELSLLRLNQLNYFDNIKPENAEIKRDTKNGTVDILLKLKEKGKQSISLTGGVSGITGEFLGLTYQTNNFLGLGETLTFTTQFGSIQRNFQFGFTEPYLFEKPITSGFTIFDSRYNFDQARETSLLYGTKVEISPDIAQNYNQNSKGFTGFVSYPLKKLSLFSRLGLTYGYTDTDIDAFSTASQLLFEALQFQAIAGPSALDGIHASRISPTLTYSRLQGSQLNPTGGKTFFASVAYNGGPLLRGNVDEVSTTFNMTYFHAAKPKRNVIAIRFLGSFITGYNGREVTPYDRFYLGGEDNLRGFDVRTVTPVVFIPTVTSESFTFYDPTVLNSGGSPTQRTISIPALIYQTAFPGGDTEAVTNLEYRIPIAGPVWMDIFTDAGATGVLRPSQLQLAESGVTEDNSVFPGAVTSSQLNVLSGTNFKLRASAGIEFVANLPIINAPVRLYWAYNFERLEKTIIAPADQFDVTQNLLSSLPPGVYNTQILPQINNAIANPQLTQFFDPVKVIRLTISRTF
jgi:outer membrane protein insertion porin family